MLRISFRGINKYYDIRQTIAPPGYMHLKLLSDDNMSKKMVLYGLCFRNSLWGISINENDCTWYGLYLRSYFFGGKATFAVLFGSNPNVLNEILHFESKVKLWKAQCTTKFIKSPEIIVILNQNFRNFDTKINFSDT